MTARTIVTILVTIGMLGLLLIGIAVAIGIQRYRAQGPDHPGANVHTPPLPPAHAQLDDTRVFPRPAPYPSPTPPPSGRHHPETVRRVAANWRPLTLGQRLRALEETQLDLMRPIPREERS